MILHLCECAVLEQDIGGRPAVAEHVRSRFHGSEAGSHSGFAELLLILGQGETGEE